MDRGSSLIEVLVAILISMLVFVAAAKLSVFSINSGGASEHITYASVFGHTKLASLVNLPSTSNDLKPGWHHDPANPINKGGVLFYRFWNVTDVNTGRKVVLSIAWNEGARRGAGEFSSENDLRQSRCMKISFTDICAGE